MALEKNQIIEKLRQKNEWLKEQNDATKKINAKLLNRDRENDQRVADRTREQELIIEQLEEELKEQQNINSKKLHDLTDQMRQQKEHSALRIEELEEKIDDLNRQLKAKKMREFMENRKTAAQVSQKNTTDSPITHEQEKSFNTNISSIRARPANDNFNLQKHNQRHLNRQNDKIAAMKKMINQYRGARDDLNKDSD